MSKVDLLASSKTATTAATAIAVVNTMAKSCVIQAKKATGDNANLVYVGTSVVGTNTTQQVVLEPRGEYTVPIPTGDWMDLNDVKIACVTSGDGVIFHYTPA